MSRFKTRTATKYIVVHCSATQPKQDLSAADIRRLHKNDFGWMDIGYHYVIRRSGEIESGRPLETVGSHVKGHNSESVGICLVGGINEKGRGEFNYTDAQMASLADLLGKMEEVYADAEILGHRDLSPDKNGDGKITSIDWLKECPCFDTREWLKTLGTTEYTVKAGDTCYRIASKHGVALETLKELNGLDEAYTIREGQVLRIK